jgi:anti-anti-sigma factor
VIHVIRFRFGEDFSFVCTPSESLDLRSTASLGDLIDLVIPGRDIVIDLRQVREVDAIGIGLLVGLVRRVRSTGDSALICNPSPRIRRKLQRAGVQKFLTSPSSTTANDAA